MSSPKRRRVSTVGDDEMILLSENVIFVAPTPMLEEIPRLLLVGTQSADSSKVIVALKRLCKLFKLKDPSDTCIDSDDNLGVQNLKTALSLGAIRLVIGVLGKWQENERIQIFGCHCVAMLLSAATSECDGKLIVAESGGIHAMVNAIRNFPRSKFVHRQAIWALTSSLSITTQDDTIKRSVYTFVEEMKGIQLVVSSMTLFAKDAMVQLLGLELFCTMSNSNTRPYQDALAKADVVTTAVVAMELHFDNEQVQNCVAKLLTYMFPPGKAKQEYELK